MLAFGMFVVGLVLGIALSALYVASGKAAGQLYVEHQQTQRHEVDVRITPPEREQGWVDYPLPPDSPYRARIVHPSDSDHPHLRELD